MHSVLGWHWSDESVPQSSETWPAAASQTKRSTEKRQRHWRDTVETETRRQSPTHNRTPTCLRAKGTTSASFRSPFPFETLSQGVTNLCHIFLCSLRICYTCYTVHTPYELVSRVSSIFQLRSSGFCCVSACIVWLLLSFFLLLFLAIIFAVGRHHRSSVEAEGEDEG